MFCPKCGAQYPDGTPFCGACGTPLTGGTQQQTAYQPPIGAAPTPQKKLPVIPIAIAAAAIALVAIIALLVVPRCSGGSAATSTDVDMVEVVSGEAEGALEKYESASIDTGDGDITYRYSSADFGEYLDNLISDAQSGDLSPNDITDILDADQAAEFDGEWVMLCGEDNGWLVDMANESLSYTYDFDVLSDTWVAYATVVNSTELTNEDIAKTVKSCGFNYDHITVSDMSADALVNLADNASGGYSDFSYAIDALTLENAALGYFQQANMVGAVIDLQCEDYSIILVVADNPENYTELLGDDVVESIQNTYVE
ncbi:Predicted membrane protein [Slackia heliotrinireducens]|uniref:Zinc-ribbon domain-containing protein n=1 Tax=Slackia heliotrinireducens (strain ATCC 29202 / DSM 20476 / NCTC 11029 / RHS 1) TaxID=471855 RepID=C7N3A0_SLAHD|nr:zinc ribbon domain-containing protein [Slackia heliotrinireducens]ACV23623.1 hypothetical protein Shel_26200 [Slackia heliotrinireducens DSM 20476]VEH03112.1 Predicted membrane protein [Slackia heliotrinireducens]